MKYEPGAELGRESSAGRNIYPSFQSSTGSLPATASQILEEVRGALPHDLAAASVNATRLALLLQDSIDLPQRTAREPAALDCDG